MTGTRSESIINRRDHDWGQTLIRLRGFIAARVEDPEVAADITQDVLARTIASGAPDRVEDLGAWLYRAARNAVIDHYRTPAPPRDRRRVGKLAGPGPGRQPSQRRHP